MSDLISKIGVVIIGCGEPKRCMGWYHAKQILDGRVPEAELTDIVEPWLLGAGKTSEGGLAFTTWAGGINDVKFHQAIDEMPKPHRKTLALIAGRTAANPQFFKQAVDHGFSHIFLEKPGASSVEELEAMSAHAKSKGVAVCMGFNKNVAKYVKDLLAFDSKRPGGVITFIHDNPYKPAELEDCFSRGQEGMLKNYFVHELTLLATYFRVSVSTIAKVMPDADLSSWETHGRYSDFRKLCFTITTKDGRTFIVKGDRCSENFSWASIALDDKQVFEARMPDPCLEQTIIELRKADPGLMEYFYMQDSEYLTLKQQFCRHILEGKTGTPEGLATIDIGIEAMKMAEYLQPSIENALRGLTEDAPAAKKARVS